MIMHYISDVATDPGSIPKPGGTAGRVFLTGLREGVEITVLLRQSEIWTAYPTNLPRNP